MKDRRIDFEKVQNVRDLGGMKTSDGRTIASGLLIRSANLSEATDADMQKLEKEYHLSKVIDLRTTMEKQEKPDVITEKLNYISVPIFDESVFGISHEKGTDNNQSSIKPPVMEDLYKMIVENEVCRTNLSKAVQIVMEHDFSTGSVLWHCTEGKDRCGLLTVMLLGALGVEREQIIEDYLLTNEVNGLKAEMYYQHMLAAGKSEAEAEAVKNIFLAKENYLIAAFSVIDEQYQDMENYLKQGLGISEELILAFKENVSVV